MFGSELALVYLLDISDDDIRCTEKTDRSMGPMNYVDRALGVLGGVLGLRLRSSPTRLDA